MIGSEARSNRELTDREIEFHDLVTMGFPNLKSIAEAMGIKSSRVSKIRYSSEGKWPILAVEFYKRTDCAIDLRAQGLGWTKISRILEYKYRTGAYDSVKARFWLNTKVRKFI